MTAPNPPRVIKQPSRVAPAFAPSRVVKSSSQAAQQILDRARADAGKLLADAAARAAAIEAEAGILAGRKADAAAGVFESLVRQEQATFARTVFDAAALISATIVGDAISRDPRPFVELLQRVAAHAGRYQALRIALHPDDADAVVPFADRVVKAIPFADSVTFEADASLGRGDVVIHTEGGRYEGGLGHVLQSLRRALADGGTHER